MTKRRMLLCPSAPRRQQGVALIVALIMLVIIGLTSASVMRATLNTDLVANNARVQNVATKAADIALRYCESQLPPVVAPVNFILQGPAIAGAVRPWETKANWVPVGTAHVPPAAQLKSLLGSFGFTRAPECLVEQVNGANLPVGVTTMYTVTARGFSPDYSEDSATGHTRTGSVVWVQSIIKY